MLERVQLALAGGLGDVHGALGAVTGIDEQTVRLAAELDQIVDGVADPLFQTAHFAAPLASLRPE
ncbi:hypothetical protein [Nocardia sp. CY41]|uniref:hypothetical protein n=1 Tax=Nocardia sp. CY41 TaxID=2608686 RepID=UPI001915E3AB|nr:hypothetical protein [Nocardia sp. CY41]